MYTPWAAFFSPEGQRLLQQCIDLALEEDGPELTAMGLFTPDAYLNAAIRAKQDTLVVGLPVIGPVFRSLGSPFRWQALAAEATPVPAMTVVARISAPAVAMLKAERVILNFITHLSGIANLTARYARELEGTGVRLLDTRKTTPGYRLLEKAAVAHGGGTNHRMGLYDRAMVKDNHLMTDGNTEHLQQCINRLRAEKPGVEIQLEADTLEQVEAFLKLEGVDHILLDNMTPEMLKQAVAMRGDRATPLIEASGGVNLDTVAAIAESGVDFVSVGYVTHSAPSLDLGLDFSVE